MFYLQPIICSQCIFGKKIRAKINSSSAKDGLWVLILMPLPLGAGRTQLLEIWKAVVIADLKNCTLSGPCEQASEFTRCHPLGLIWCRPNDREPESPGVLGTLPSKLHDLKLMSKMFFLFLLHLLVFLGSLEPELPHLGGIFPGK